MYCDGTGVTRSFAVHKLLIIQKIYYSLQQQKVKSVKRRTTITELVVVWSLCSVYTSVTESKAVTLRTLVLFAIAIVRSRKISVITVTLDEYQALPFYCNTEKL